MVLAIFMRRDVVWLHVVIVFINLVRFNMSRTPISFIELKTIEKMDALVRYSPLLPIIHSDMMPFDTSIETPTYSISTLARLKSKSLILAHGGPELFFTILTLSK